MTVSIVTPWRDALELAPDYEAAVRGAQVVIVDHCSDPAAGVALQELAGRLGNGSVYLRDVGAWNFARLNNRGLRRATGETVIFLNNDISASAPWLDLAARDCAPGVLCGPAPLTRVIDGRPLVYLEGWCIGARRDVWNAVGPWNEEYQGGYWEDNELCYRAVKMGYVLRGTAWPLRHKSNYTSSATPGAYAHSDANRDKFESLVAADA